MTDNLEKPQINEQDTVLSTANDSSIDTSIPEKFKVVTEDGAVDYKATVAKMNESYSYLEKKVGTGEVVNRTGFVGDFFMNRTGFVGDFFI